MSQRASLPLWPTCPKGGEPWPSWWFWHRRRRTGRARTSAWRSSGRWTRSGAPTPAQAKLSRDACTVELRLAVIAPDFADSDAVQARLDRLVAAYRPFALATGN